MRNIPTAPITHQREATRQPEAASHRPRQFHALRIFTALPVVLLTVLVGCSARASPPDTLTSDVDQGEESSPPSPSALTRNKAEELASPAARSCKSNISEACGGTLCGPYVRIHWEQRGLFEIVGIGTGNPAYVDRLTETEGCWAVLAGGWASPNATGIFVRDPITGSWLSNGTPFDVYVPEGYSGIQIAVLGKDPAGNDKWYYNFSNGYSWGSWTS